MNNQSNQPFTLITGASKGIGLALAKECARRGMNLLLISRNEQSLYDLSLKIKSKYPVEVNYYAADLSKDGSAREVFDWCINNNYKVNMLINNAGMGLFGPFEDIDIEKQMYLTNLNMNSVVSLCYYFLPMLQKNKTGYLLNVASIAALYPLPYYSVYGASNGFVLSFTKALQFEYRDSQLKISCLCPGDTDTNFFKAAGNLSKKDKLMDPSIVAEVALNELMEGKRVIFPSYVKKVAKIPRFLLERIVAKRTLRYF